MLATDKGAVGACEQQVHMQGLATSITLSFACCRYPLYPKYNGPLVLRTSKAMNLTRKGSLLVSSHWCLA